MLASGTTCDELLALVRLLAAQLQPQKKDHFATLTSQHRLSEDFGLDSLARVELAARIEQQFGIAVGEAALTAATVEELWQSFASQHPVSPVAPSERAALEPGGQNFVPAPASLSTLIAVLDWHATHQPQRTHLIFLDEHEHAHARTYGQIAHAARQVAARLLQLGTEPGARVALMLPSGPGFFAAFYGILYAGAVPVPLYPPARPQLLADHLRRVAGVLTNAEAQWLVSDAQVHRFADALAGRVDSLAGVWDIEALCSGAPLSAAPLLRTEDLALLQYTSGSTGDPKGVMLTHANLLANLRAMQQATNASDRDVFVSWLPLYHDMGLIGAALGSMLVGFPLVLMSPLSFLARPARWLQAISRYRGTISAAPNFAYELCAQKIRDEELDGVDLSCWRLACNGAEAVSAATLERFAARFAPYGFAANAMTPVYGLAECSVGLCFPPLGRGPRIDHLSRSRLMHEGVAAPCPPTDPEARAVVACGYPLVGHEVRVVSPSGVVLPERHVGRIQFRGPSATAGYFRRPDATQALCDGDWRHTGDLGYLSEDGELFLTGREKDLIIRAGRNVYPHELEEAIGTLDGVRKGNVAVFAAADADTGTEKLVVLAETKQLSLSQATALRQEIEQLAIALTGIAPDDIVLAPPGTVFKTSSGKIRRSACREAYERGVLLRQAQQNRLALGMVALASLHGRLRQHFRHAQQALWSLWARAVYLFVGSALLTLVGVLPTINARRWAVHWGARGILTLAGVAWRVEGRENLPSSGPCVVVANHASYADGLVLSAALPPRFAFVAKAELQQEPLYGWLLRRLGTLFVERFKAAKSAADAEAMHEALCQGQALIVFPEGTFRDAPGLLPFRLGAFQAAVKANAPLVPITLRGTRPLLTGEQRWPRRHPVAVIIHPPLAPEQESWDETLRLRDLARDAIARGLS